MQICDEVIIVDTCPIYVRGLQDCLQNLGISTNHFLDVDEAQNKVVTCSNSNLVIIGLHVHTHAGFNFCHWVKAQGSSKAKVIYASRHAEDTLFKLDAIYAGVRACVAHTASMSDWQIIILDVIADKNFFPHEMIVQALTPISISPSEIEVMRLVSKGMTDKEIANCLVKGVSTIRSQVQSAIEKLGVNNRINAVHRAKHRGII